MAFIGDNVKIQSDEWYFLQLLPDVVWKKTLKKLKDPTDLESSTNASQYFRKHLFSRRTTFLFPKVFLSVAPRYDGSYSKFFDDSTQQLQLAALDQNRVWKYPGGYRLICQKWNQTVQQYYQGHKSHFWTLTDIADNKWPRVGRCSGYYNWEDISINFLNFFQETHASEILTSNKNPIFQRALRLFVSSRDIGGNANEVVERFLEIYGHEIWYLKLEITNTNDTLTQFYFALKYLLEMMPNLRVLRLWYIKGQKQGWRAKSKLRQAVKICPLEEFSHLKFLEILTNLPSPILNELLIKNSRVYKLNILAAGSKVLSLHLPNLRELFIRVRSMNEFYRLFRKGKKWKLETFQCMFTCWNTEATFGEIFKLIAQTWSGSLKNLYIFKPSSGREEKRIIKATTKSELHLPLLTTFKLSIRHSVGVDFLLPSAKNLEAIIIDRLPGFKKLNHIKYEKYVWQQRIYFLGFEKDLEASNIWVQLPKLKKVLSGAGTYYRP